MIASVRAELRKSFSTRLWWALLIPVGVLAVLATASGGVFEGLVAGRAGALPSLLPVTMAYALTLTSVFSAVLGGVAAGGEFRHRTVTTSYLIVRGRGAALGGKLVVSALVGAGYGLVSASIGLLSGMVGGSTAPDPAVLAQVTAFGVAVCALWAVFGSALGVAIGNQVGALVLLLIYLLLGEFLVSILLNNADSPAVAELSGYLPGNAGDVALLTPPVLELAGPSGAADVLLVLASVTDPPSAGVSLLVLAGWTALVVGLAVLLGGRRDIT